MTPLDTLFLDRDGVLNKKIENGYVLNTGQIEIIPGVAEFLKSAKAYFTRIVVVTNQRCVGRGLLAMENLERINEEINRRTGSLIAKFYICPHLDTDNCGCRKPKEGLFLAAQKDFNIDFSKSWMIGDSISDIVPAKRLGVFTLLHTNLPSPLADVNFASFDKLVSIAAELIGMA